MLFETDNRPLKFNESTISQKDSVAVEIMNNYYQNNYSKASVQLLVIPN